MKLKLKTDSFGIIMHVMAGLAVVYGVLVTSTIDTQTAPQQTVQALWMIKYLLFGLFFEIVALNCRNYYDEKMDNQDKK